VTGPAPSSGYRSMGEARRLAGGPPLQQWPGSYTTTMSIHFTAVVVPDGAYKVAVALAFPSS
jgi:hypothetical protein